MIEDLELKKDDELRKNSESPIAKGFWAKIFNKDKLKKPEQVAVLYLRENRRAEPMYIVPKNGFFDIAGKQYHERRDCQYLLGKDKIPLAIIPEWKLIPIGTKDYDDLPIEERLVDLQQHTINAIRHAEVVRMEGDTGAKPNMKVIIIIIIAAVVGLALLKNYI